MAYTHREHITHTDLAQILMRAPPAKRMRRLRIIWFLLGAIAGGAAAYGVAMHEAREYSKLHSHVTFAQLSNNQQVTKIVPFPLPAPAPAQAAALQSLPVAAGPNPKPAFPASMNVSVRRGDTLMSVLTDRGIAYAEAYNIVHSMRKVYNPKNLGVGQSVELHLDKSKYDSGKLSVTGMSIAVSPLRTIALSRAADNSFSIREVKTSVFKSLARGGGMITSSLYQTGVDSGVPPQMLNDVVNAFSYDVDFQRDIHEGDILDVIYERMHTEKGVTTGYGKVIYAALTLDGETHAIYYHTSPDGYSGFYNAKGESVKKALLRTPINGSHITSGFGMRMHPLLGYSKMHKGIDFGAVTGTPIYAAGDGVIKDAGRRGGYGNYVRIKHNNNYETAYGHASRIARGIRPGVHVRQGQVIAYVGSTGMSTGPHLHYEILVGGRQVNPSGVRFRTGQTLQGRESAQFRQQLKQVQVALSTLPKNTVVASIK